MAAIDVIMPMKDCATFVAESIDSIRGQTFRDWRLLVLDHGSRDGSVELAHRHAEGDGRIEIYSFPDADGVAELRNIGLAKCDCRYVMLQDADDVSFADRMEVCSQAFAALPDLLAMGGDAVVVDTQGRRMGRLSMPTAPRAVAAASFFYYPMLHPTITVNFSTLRRLGAAYGKDILNVVPTTESVHIKRLAEDYVLFGQLALLGPCANVRMPLIKYRRHPASVGIANPIEQIALSLQISRFLAKSFCLMKGLEAFDPAPFCNHADYVFDCQLDDYSREYAHMANNVRCGLGTSMEVERELAFRRVLATRSAGRMLLRHVHFEGRHRATAQERRTVRNWLLRHMRNGKYVYRDGARPLTDVGAMGRMTPRFR
jgi:glycosyltransferase involved in cell wall biosynthesis